MGNKCARTDDDVPHFSGGDPSQLQRQTSSQQTTASTAISGANGEEVENYDDSKPCNWRDVGDFTKMVKRFELYRSSEVFTDDDLKRIKKIIDLRRPKDIEKTEKEILQARRNTTAEVRQIESPAPMPRRATTVLPDGVKRERINFVPTHPTGIAIFRAIPKSEAFSAICPWNDTELKMQMNVIKYLRFGGLYTIILNKSKPQILEALLVFADLDNYPILVHCIHGKDRTGLLIALVLLICEVPEEEVLNDFSESEIQLLAAKASGEPKMSSYNDMVLKAPRGAMKDVFEWLKENTGESSICAASCKYAVDIGMTYEQLNVIRNHLMEGEHEQLKAPILASKTWFRGNTVSTSNTTAEQSPPSQHRNTTSPSGITSRLDQPPLPPQQRKSIVM